MTFPSGFSALSPSSRASALLTTWRRMTPTLIRSLTRTPRSPARAAPPPPSRAQTRRTSRCGSVPCAVSASSASPRSREPPSPPAPEHPRSPQRCLLGYCDVKPPYSSFNKPNLPPLSCGCLCVNVSGATVWPSVELGGQGPLTWGLCGRRGLTSHTKSTFWLRGKGGNEGKGRHTLDPQRETPPRCPEPSHMTINSCKRS